MTLAEASRLHHGDLWEHILRQCLLVKHLKVLLLFHRRGDRLPQGAVAVYSLCVSGQI